MKEPAPTKIQKYKDRDGEKLKSEGRPKGCSEGDQSGAGGRHLGRERRAADHEIGSDGREGFLAWLYLVEVMLPNKSERTVWLWEKERESLRGQEKWKTSGRAHSGPARNWSHGG